MSPRLSEGGQRWQIMLADFVAPNRGRPHLAHIRIVGPAFGVYETQQWAPDGSGFLFTAFGPRESPFQTTFDAPDPGATGTPQFLADFSDPNFRSDLFMVDVRTHDLRELTDTHNVVPEFNWNDDYTRLIWSGVVGGSNHNFITRVAGFRTITATQRRPPSAIPAPGLYGEPINMGRVRSNARVHARALALDDYTLWLSRLKQLGTLAGLDIGAPTLLAADRGL